MVGHNHDTVPPDTFFGFKPFKSIKNDLGANRAYKALPQEIRPKLIFKAFTGNRAYKALPQEIRPKLIFKAFTENRAYKALLQEIRPKLIFKAFTETRAYKALPQEIRPKNNLQVSSFFTLCDAIQQRFYEFCCEFIVVDVSVHLNNRYIVTDVCLQILGPCGARFGRIKGLSCFVNC